MGIQRLRPSITGLLMLTVFVIRVLEFEPILSESRDPKEVGLDRLHDLGAAVPDPPTVAGARVDGPVAADDVKAIQKPR